MKCRNLSKVLVEFIRNCTILCFLSWKCGLSCFYDIEWIHICQEGQEETLFVFDPLDYPRRESLKKTWSSLCYQIWWASQTNIPRIFEVMCNHIIVWWMISRIWIRHTPSSKDGRKTKSIILNFWINWGTFCSQNLTNSNSNRKLLML